MIVTTTFRNIRDNVPVLATFDDWSSFAAHLERQSRTEASDKARTECLTPAIYADGTTRAKRNALGWNWFAADIDNKEGNGQHSTIAAISAKCVAANLPHVIYTTTSSRTDAECFRLMFPLDRLVEADDFSAFWQSVAQWLGCVDEQTKDVSRLFVAPRRWSGADNAFLRRDEGAPLDVAMIRALYPVKEAPRSSRTLCEAFSTVDGLKDVCPTMVSLYGPFVSENALSNAQTGDRGGRMFAFLLSVATRALLKGYAITPDHLEDIGFEFANSIGRETSDIRHDARNAHTRALEHYASAKAERLQKLSPHEAYLARWSK